MFQAGYNLTNTQQTTAGQKSIDAAVIISDGVYGNFGNLLFFDENFLLIAIYSKNKMCLFNSTSKSQFVRFVF